MQLFNSRTSNATALCRRRRQPTATALRPCNLPVRPSTSARTGGRQGAAQAFIAAAAAAGDRASAGGEDDEMVFSSEQLAQPPPPLPDAEAGGESAGRSTESHKQGAPPGEALAGEGATTEAESLSEDRQQQQQAGPQAAAGKGGGRFDEEPAFPEHPYDPRPRERGHGIPPHAGPDNTHAPGDATGAAAAAGRGGGGEPVGQAEPARSGADSIVGRHPEGDEQNPAAAI